MIAKDLGIVTKRVNFRETSIVVNVFTKNYGRISGILKGFYRGRKEFTSSLDIFTLNEILFYPRKSSLWLISSADLIRNFPYLYNDYYKACIAAKFIKIIEKVIPYGERNKEIFSLFYLSLLSLEKFSPYIVFCVFFIKFLNFSGFKPNLNSCLSCGSSIGKICFFAASQGGLICQRCRKKYTDVEIISPQTVAFIKYIQKEKFFSSLRVNPDKKIKEEMFSLLNTFFLYHLDFSLDDLRE
ncbi:MAG: DNA repair protein RecO [Candidatus Omnitrophica bacterium 4484_70.2]|nr:MAG: DNA repair protein RecO [Candidatus Omnitrophica bacterium 4484_70.2]